MSIFFFMIYKCDVKRSYQWSTKTISNIPVNFNAWGQRSEETKDSPVLSFLVDRWWRWGGAVWRGGEELRGLRRSGGTAWWGVVGGAVVGTTGRWPVARPVKLNVTLPQTTMQLSPWRSKHREPNHFIILQGFSTVKHSYSERL